MNNGFKNKSVMTDIIDVPGVDFDIAVVDKDKVKVDEEANERLRNPDPSSKNADLVESIQESGLNTPPKARPDGNGNYLVFQGQRRLLAIQKLGWETIPLIIEDIDEIEALQNSVIENNEFLSKDVHRKDRAKAIQKLVDEQGIKDVADSFGMTEQAIRGWLEPMREEWEGTMFDPDVETDVETEEIADDIQRGIRRITDGGKLGEEISKRIIERNIPPTYVRDAIEETDSPENFWDRIVERWKVKKKGQKQIRPSVTFTGDIVEQIKEESLQRGISEEEVIKKIVERYFSESEGKIEVKTMLPENISQKISERSEQKDLPKKALARDFINKTLESKYGNSS